MAVTIGEVCAEVHNYFVDEPDGIHTDNYTVADGAVTPLDFLIEGQYFRIECSVLNDGVYLNDGKPIEALRDETFYGRIWAMKVPVDFVELVKKISEWDDKYGGVNSSNMSPYQSESYAGQYSYTKANGTSDATSSKGLGWQAQFSTPLFRYRKVHET